MSLLDNINGVQDSTLAPKFSIDVANTNVDGNIKDFITSVEYESCDGIADVLRLRCDNPDGMVSNAKIFQPGNEVSVYFGYKEPLKHIGRIIIQRPVLDFPENGMPSIQIVGYTKDASMTGSPEESKKRRFKNYRYSDAVYEIADRYKMEYDIDDTEEDPHNWFQKSGVSDYELVQGMANLSGYIFWVDGDSIGKWYLHFKNPNNLKDQEKKYTFKYNDGDYSTLLSFRPEMLITGAKTKITVVTKDRKTGKIIKVDVEEENNNSPDIQVSGDPQDTVKGNYTTASDIKLFFGEYSFEAISNKRFKNQKQALLWAQQWFRRNRENFILANNCKCIGTETLMARQIHAISNIGTTYDGDYFFSKVKHTFNSSGYNCYFSCRKVMP
ncbi:MAG: hypothetical protein BV456_06710 [Thermoplasmata archaeon M8B2D]|nr:MAG: hypothetical protein BV456_06710 [Thermoplasmata archaeon M8B2D]